MLHALKFSAALLLCTGIAHASTIPLDDFATFQAATDLTADGIAASTSGAYSLGGNLFTRTLSVNQISHTSRQSTAQSSAVIEGGELNISNQSGTNSEIDLTYGIDALIDDFSTSSTLMLSVLSTDFSFTKPLSIEAFLNGVSLGSQSFDHPRSDINFSLTALGGSGNQLRLRFVGADSFDSAVGPLSLSVSDVPEPAALGLLGLGLAGIAAARRRKR